MIGRLLLLMNTVRYLRARQIIYRPIRLIQARFPARTGPPEQIAASNVAALRQALTECGPDDIGARIGRADAIVKRRFTFLNTPVEFAVVPWRARPVSALWSFNLQYFDYAVDLAWAFRETGERRYLQAFEDLYLDWDRSTRDRRGDAWAPYVISERVVNLVYAFLLLEPDLDPVFTTTLLNGIHQQTQYLERRLEWHLLGNHLLKNLHAIATIGLVFDGPVAERWREQITSRFFSELGEQVLDDGGHFERSPMYHALVLSDLLQLLLLRQASGYTNPDTVLGAARKMVGALRLMSRPNGDLRLFNDAANGVAPRIDWVVRMAEAAGVGSDVQRRCWKLAKTGYYGASRGGFEVMIDCGIPGPTYQPGHAHCDMLSYELDYDGRPLIVDAGVSDYAPGPWREYARSTRAHNTVVIGGNEQSELWDSFRMGRRATIVYAEMADNGDVAVPLFRGAYKPYKTPSATHHRKFFLDGGVFRVTDRIAGDSSQAVTSFVHFHPQCRVERQGGVFAIVRGEARFRFEPFGFTSVEVVHGEANPAQGWYMPEFGVRVAAPVLVLHLKRNLDSEFGYALRT
ncbi:MAG TPA: alginate lyase family protein [Gemmatimonadaceae bacterium]|nr:alginate lyase family protein [Gemmatimonadaceae bacterium]